MIRFLPVSVFLFFFIVMPLALQNVLKAQPVDWRNIRNGNIIPDDVYCDQPYVVQTDDSAWLCILTTGSGREGASGQYVAATRSEDLGQTWSELVPLEPKDGPEASYAVPLKVPSGRIYVFYNHNTDNVRELLTVSGDTIRRVDSQGYFVFKYSDDDGRSWSEQRYTIPVREFEIDRKNVYGGKIRFFWNVGKPFTAETAAYVPLHKVGGFGQGFFTSNEGVLLMSPNILSENDPEKIRWETLPDGDIGLRTPQGGGPIAAEQSFTVLSDGSIYCVYRTIDGHPVYTYSRDGGHTWDAPAYLRYANGRLIKHPRAANFVWKCQNGKYLYWFHNHGGRFIREHPGRSSIGYNDRNPAWIAGGIERDGPDGRVIDWTQPEILLYDDDPLIRMSYPDLTEELDRYFITETQKDVARVHEIDTNLLYGLWSQYTNREQTTDGLAVAWDLENTVLPTTREGVRLGSFYARDPRRDDHGGMHIRSGFSLELQLSLTDLHPGQILLDTRNATGKGIVVRTSTKQNIVLSMSDSRSVSLWESDQGTLRENVSHNISIIVDGGPKIVLFVTDGVLNDGGDTRQFGWGRFNPYLQDVNGAEDWTFGDNFSGSIQKVYVYQRALRVSEAIANYHCFLAAQISPK
jgi:hypothetical protein